MDWKGFFFLKGVVDPLPLTRTRLHFDIFYLFTGGKYLTYGLSDEKRM